MLEIERKFLIHLSKLPTLGRPQIIHQAYLMTDEARSLRIRQKDGQYILSIKIDAGGITRHEHEIDISPDMGAQLFAAPLIGAVIEKRRYQIGHGAHLWELDIFEGGLKGLYIAEIELGDEDEVFERPEWIGEEITHDKRYQNSMIALHGKPEP